MRIVFMGTPDFAVPALKSLVENKYEVAAVYTQPDKFSGRGRSTVTFSPVKQTAAEYGIPVFQPANLKSEAVQSALRDLHPDAVIVAAYGVILPVPVLKIPPIGCINIHPSLLPRYRGVAPVPAAILNGDDFTGVSIMLLDKGIDTGPIFARASLPITGKDTAGLMMEKLSYAGAHLLLDVLARLVKNGIIPRPQDDPLASYTRRLEKTDGEIGWQKTALEISRQVRALQPWPGSYTRWQGKQLLIVEGEPQPAVNPVPGRVVMLPDTKGFGIETLDGVLAVSKVQLEGKRLMAAVEFIRGHQQLVGAVLPN